MIAAAVTAGQQPGLGPDREHQDRAQQWIGEGHRVVQAEVGGDQDQAAAVEMQVAVVWVVD